MSKMTTKKNESVKPMSNEVFDGSSKKIRRMTVLNTPDIYNLTKLESSYFGVINAQRYGGGLLFLTGSPGTAKSSIFRKMAEKLNLNYLDVRMAGADETEIGNYPSKVIYNYTIDGKEYEEEVVKHIPPQWAVMANEKPTLIHFEEIDRSPKPVRNAILQVINERMISYHFKFNSNVYMVASGNLNTDDDTEEMGSALKGRLVHIEHKMSLNYWIENYAKENIHEIIVDYLLSNPEEYSPTLDSNYDDIGYPSPRTWSNLSNYIVYNYTEGILENVQGGTINVGILSNIENIVPGYIGNKHSVKFLDWVKENIGFNIFDIISNYDKYRTKIKKDFNRSKAQGFMSKITNSDTFNIFELEEKEIDNLFRFWKETYKINKGGEEKIFGDDQIVAYVNCLVFEKSEEIFKVHIDSEGNEVRTNGMFLKKLKKEFPIMIDTLKAILGMS